MWTRIRVSQSRSRKVDNSKDKQVYKSKNEEVDKLKIIKPNYSQSNQDVVVATSIVPIDIENQRKAIDTWIHAGFKVISLNCHEEWEKIHPYFPDIQFEIVKRDARGEYGKPYVYFDDFMEFFKKIDNRVCGIINSDIYLLEIDKDFKKFIIKESENALVFGHRRDIDSLANLNGVICPGNDYFFFDKSITDLFPKEEFCIGQPAWDYWMVFIPMIKNIKVKKIIDPIAYHIKHELKWRYEIDIKFKKMMLNKYLGDFSEITWFDSIGHIKLQNMIESYPEKISYRNHNHEKEVIVATSIAPQNIENQRKAIDTWMHAGFKVVSLNCHEEWEKIHSHFPDIQFEIVKRDARDKYEKPYVYFDDFIEFFKKTDNQVCGIINSDIHLLDLLPNFKDFVISEASNSFVFGSRIDIQSLDDKNGNMYKYGFDYFFFAQSVTHLYPGAEFFIGQPAWDYWVVIIPILNKIKVKKVIDSIAYHVEHPINWEANSHKIYIKRMREKIGNNICDESNISEDGLDLLNYINKHCEETTIYK